MTAPRKLSTFDTTENATLILTGINVENGLSQIIEPSTGESVFKPVIVMTVQGLPVAHDDLVDARNTVTQTWTVDTDFALRVIARLAASWEESQAHPLNPPELDEP